MAERWRRLLPGLWAGLLLAVAAIAAPSAFATLEPTHAGRVVARLFAQEAYASLAFAVAVIVLQRRVAAAFDTPVLFALGAVFCTVAGYFALLPMMDSARAGQGVLSFGQLHMISLTFFATKTILVLALAWRTTAPLRRPTS